MAVRRSMLPVRTDIDFLISVGEEDEAGGDRHADGQERLCEPCDDVDFVHDVHTPLTELIER
jgi:hypothetical protein